MSSGSYTVRTRLAWRRTVLLGALSTLLLIRLSIERGVGWLAVSAALIWLGLAVVGQLRIRALVADDTAPVGAALSAAVVLAVAFAAIGAAAALVS